MLWFVLASAFVIAMNQSTMQPFDHDNRLAMQLMSLDFESQLVSSLANAESMEGARVVHLSSGNGCFCQTLVTKHVTKIDTLLQNSQARVFHIDIDNYPELQKQVPSTPAIAVINQHEKLLYFGPYSQGSGCFSASGAVDAVIKTAFIQTEPAPANSPIQTVIVAEANGCYCNQA